jgi:uncharacterized spore protein YtfJ
MKSWQDTYTVRRVFGDPVEKDGVTIIPVAQVSGGGGGGGAGIAPEENADGAESSGGGFGGNARPVGVFVVRADGVEWQPALDVTLLGVLGIALAALMTLTLGWALGRKR